MRHADTHRIRRFFRLILALGPLSLVPWGAHGLRPTLSAAEDTPAVLISRQLLARSHLKVGDNVTFATDASGHHAKSFHIVGVYEPTPDPMRFTQERLEARLHLADLIALTADGDDPQSAESLTAVNIAVASPSDRDDVASILTARNPGIFMRPTARPSDGDPFAVLERFHLAIAVVTVAGSTAFLIALMLIRAEERRETVGVLRLIGISRRSIMLEVVVEALIVAAIGAAFGVALAGTAQYGVNAYFQHRYDTALVFVRVTPRIAARSIAVALPVGIFAGVIASWLSLRGRTILAWR